MRPIALLLIGAAACLPAAAAPTVDCLTRVRSDTAKGWSFPQILADVDIPCAIDAALLAAILLASEETEIVTSRAYGEAKEWRLMHEEQR